MLGVEIGDVAHRLFAMEQGVKETHQKLLVELGTEQAFEAEISMRVYISFCHNTCFKQFTIQIYCFSINKPLSYWQNRKHKQRIYKSTKNFLRNPQPFLGKHHCDIMDNLHTYVKMQS